MTAYIYSGMYLVEEVQFYGADALGRAVLAGNGIVSLGEHAEEMT